MSRRVLQRRVAPLNQTIRTPEAAGYEDYTAQEDQSWYAVTLRDLNEDEVAEMVSASALGDRNSRRVREVVFQVTRGHPASARLILDAIGQQPSAQTDLGSILDWPEHEEAGTTVADRLLQGLLQDFPAEALEDLVTGSAARDLHMASRLAAHSGMLTGSTDETPAVFRPDLWTSSDTEGRMVMRTVLRSLLLRKLAARDPGHPAVWPAVHGWLRQDYCERGDEAGELYHALALGELELVVRHLAGGLPTTDVEVWLDLVHSVTQAPQGLRHSGPPGDALHDLSVWTDPREQPVAPLARLVAALWIAANAIGGGQERTLHLACAEAYTQLAPFSANGYAVLLEEAEKRRQLADYWS